MPINFAIKLPDDPDKPRLAMTKPEFEKLQQQAIWDALHAQDSQNPVFAEVQRLVNDYAVMLQYYWDNNNNTLPGLVKVSCMHPIEKIAMSLATKGMALKLGVSRKATTH
jgi:hypothetical protein